MALPDVTERLSHGEPAWFVRGKETFVMSANHHHDDRVAFWCAASPGAQDALVRSRPTSFFVPPYVGYRGWLGVYLDVPVDWEEIAELGRVRTVASRRKVSLTASRQQASPATVSGRRVELQSPRRGQLLVQALVGGGHDGDGEAALGFFATAAAVQLAGLRDGGDEVAEAVADEAGDAV